MAVGNHQFLVFSKELVRLETTSTGIGNFRQRQHLAPRRKGAARTDNFQNGLGVYLVLVILTAYVVKRLSISDSISLHIPGIPFKHLFGMPLNIRFVRIIDRL